jgi:ribose 1,5-bisphosphokinase
MTQATLFYLVGPSGSGKDALLAYAREHVAGSVPVLISHRYITRPSQAGGENHIALTPAEFDQRMQLGLFALSWQSHQYNYGIGVEIDTWLQAGAHVVVNGSREYLPQASQRYPHMQVILLEVSAAVIRQRLVERGRETAQEIEARIAHNQQLPPIEHPHLHVLNNDSSLSETGAKLMALLTGEA